MIDLNSRSNNFFFYLKISSVSKGLETESYYRTSQLIDPQVMRQCFSYTEGWRWADSRIL